MIYLSVGNFYKGFDRLVSFIDNFCRKKKIKCIAQIGGGNHLPNYIKYAREFSYNKHFANIKKSHLVITHGGFGNISELISAKKPFIVFPRKNIEAPNVEKVHT